jgi:hypothetical protein
VGILPVPEKRMSLITFARRLASDGQLSLSDAHRVIEEAGRTGTADEVRALFSDPGVAGLMSPGARRRLEGFMSAQAPSAGAIGALPSGTQVFVKEGNFVSAPDAPLPATAPEYGQALYTASRIFAEPGADPLAQMSQGEKEAVVDRILVGLTQCPAGPTPPGYDGPTQAAQQRSASATVLRSIMESLAGGGGTERLLQDKALQALLKLVENESIPGLRDHMAFHLHALKGTLADADQVAAVEKAFEVFAPTHPPVDEWFKDGNRQLNVVCHTGGEFFDSEIRLWEQDGFEVQSRGGYGEPTILEKKMDGPDGEITVQLRMVRGAGGTFEDMDADDVHVVAYSGHSSWGKNMPRELKGAPDAEDPKKVMLIHQCCGQGIINKIRDKYPESDLVTTRYSSYEREDHFAFRTVLEGLVGRSSWDEIHDDVANGSYWENARNNYITPADEYTRIKSRDRDGDGKADLLDRLYDFDSFDVPGDTETAFEKNPPSNRDLVLSGEKIHNASQIVNVSAGFSDFLEHEEQGLKFVSDGFFEADAGSPDADKMIRLKTERVDIDAAGLDVDKANIGSNAQNIVKVQLNRDFAHASEEVVKAVTFVEVALSHAIGAQKSRRMLQGLILAVHSLDVDEEYGRERLIFSEVIKAYGLPDSLTYDDARKALKADSHTYAGSNKGLNEWIAKLPPGTLDQIENVLS